MFTISSKFYQFCVAVYRLICLNVLFLVFSLPVITTGAALAALLETLTTTDDINIWSPFLQAFKRKFVRSLPLMGFTIASFFFIQSLQVASVGGSALLQLIKLVFISFVISYNLNVYLVEGLVSQKKIMEVFNLSFIFTLGTFFKTCFFPLLVIGMAYLSLSIIGYGTFFFVFSLPMMVYLVLLRKDIQKIKNNEELAEQQLVESHEGVL